MRPAGGRAGCISRSPELDPPPAQGGTQEQETSEHRYKSSLCHSIQFRLCRVSVIERQILNPLCVCVSARVCLCVLCADVRDSIPLSPMPSSPTVSLFSRMSSAPSMLLALKTAASSCSPSSHSHRCTSSSDQSAACSSGPASPGNPLPAKKRDRKPLDTGAETR